MKRSTVTGQLKRLGIAYRLQRASDPQVEDDALHLEGEFDGVHIQLGRGYYNVSMELPSGNFVFITGNGDVRDEINQAVTHRD